MVAKKKKLKTNICFMYFLQGLTYVPTLTILSKTYDGSVRETLIFGISNLTLIY